MRYLWLVGEEGREQTGEFLGQRSLFLASDQVDIASQTLAGSSDLAECIREMDFHAVYRIHSTGHALEILQGGTLNFQGSGS